MAMTWGYIKEASLMKLDMSSEQANKMGLLNKFPFYTREALVHIASAIKPNRTFAKFNAVTPNTLANLLVAKWPQELLEFLSTDYNYAYLDDTQKLIVDYIQANNFVLINEPISMPDNFISFGFDINKILDNGVMREVLDGIDYCTHGSNSIILLKEGVFYISYNAQWDCPTPTTLDSVVLQIPDDILVCIPSYIASQCYKIDDDMKAQIYRNEYELALARIDDNIGSTNGTFH